MIQVIILMDFTCSEENASDSNFSFLIWPSTFGVLKSVLQNNSTDVTADFELVGEYTVTNLNDVAFTYYIYRTNDTGAFNDDVVLTVTLKRCLNFLAKLGASNEAYLY